MSETLSVADLLTGVETALLSTYPGPVWVRGEISGLRRTNRGAAFLKLVDSDNQDQSVEVGVRGRILAEIDTALNAAGVGSLRSGIEVRLEVMVTLRRGTSLVQLSLMRVDPEFIAGKLAVDREEVLRRLQADRLLEVNGSLPIPLVPLRVGLVTSRGSAAHADFLNHLKAPGYRFQILTAEAMMQGETSPEQVIRGLDRLAREPVDMVALVRGGGSKLDLSTFDDEGVARRIAAMPQPVITGIGSETDRSIADEVAAVAEKTPTAAAGWLVTKVSDFAGRIDRAEESIRDESSKAIARANSGLNHLVAQIAGSREALRRQEDGLSHLRDSIVDSARRGVQNQRSVIDSYSELISTMGLERTLRRGFTVVTRPDGSAVREAASLSRGDRVSVRFADGRVSMEVEGRDE
ncbi:MAG: exodeoxyribonuclease VII large subunit [Actinobacteria bacterium]|nr:MAG: exodeoxyribonuclease VII large subunit [Actinomycetota bacterium]